MLKYIGRSVNHTKKNGDQINGPTTNPASKKSIRPFFIL